MHIWMYLYTYDGKYSRFCVFKKSLDVTSDQGFTCLEVCAYTLLLLGGDDDDDNNHHFTPLLSKPSLQKIC